MRRRAEFFAPKARKNPDQIAKLTNVHGNVLKGILP
jgi:hypothetical protein